MSETTTIGDRLKRLRGERGLSQAELAERADVSIDVVRKLEQGVRQSARITSLRRLAQALGVSTSALLDRRPRLEGAADAVNLLRVRDVLLSPSMLPGIDSADDTGEATPASDLDAAVRAAWEDYWSGRFGRLAASLPGLMGEARVTTQRGGARATTALAQAYQLAACTFVHMGWEDLATIAAERGVIAASTGDDELQWATLNGTYSWVLLAQARLDDAERHAVRVAERIEPVMSSATPEHLTAWGALLLTAVAPAAAAGRAAEVGDYISLAGAGAARLEADRHEYQATFGPTQVSVQATHGYTVLGQPRRALDAAKQVRREDLRPIAWGRYLLDVAQSQIASRREDAGLETLQTALSVAPEWFRHQPPAREMVADLIERRRRLTPVLRTLARAVELTPN